MTDSEEIKSAPRGPDVDESMFEGLVPVTRRELLGLIGSSLALTGLEACTRQPNEKIVPYVRAPEEVVPGKPLYYASAISLSGYAQGVLVESHLGRPTKIEGNPRHPASRGGTDAFTQAAVRTLYDPERSRTVAFGGRISAFEALLEALGPRLAAARALKGAGVRIVSGAISSPTLVAQIGALLSELPEMRWCVHEPISRDNVRAGAKLAYGRELETYYRLDRARTVVALESNFLVEGPGAVRYARDFAAHRRARRSKPASVAVMSRLYAVESSPTLTGAKADHRLALSPKALSRFIRALAADLGVGTVGAGTAVPGDSESERAKKWRAALVKELLANRGETAIIAGDGLPAEIHALVHAINHALGNVGKSVVHTEPVLAAGANLSLVELAAEMAAGKVDIAVFLGGTNPVYSAPADVDFAAAMSKVPLRIHHGIYEDETSARCHWHVPESHALESWSDARAYDGTLGIVQPLIAPLYASKTAEELVSALAGAPRKLAWELVREYWKKKHGAEGFDHFWDKALHDGLFEGTGSAPLELPAPAAPPPAAPDNAQGAPGLQVSFRPDPTIWDGRFAHNGWLQELAKPITKNCWENSVWISPRTAKRLGLETSEIVEVKLSGRTVTGGLIVVPGHAEDTITLFLGYGRKRAGTHASGIGYDAYRLRASDHLWSAEGAELKPTGVKNGFSITQEHHRMEGRELVRTVTAPEVGAREFTLPGEKPPPKSLSLYPERPYDGNAWGMSIDLTACTGCNACVIACQSENNIPTVGADQVRRGREMLWIRVDQYFEGPDEDPEIHHQPVLCQHCENAPCEVVCPVGATVHSATGLNEMIYNRCIGTRYCSHNCPYKVRRFNFLQYSETKESPLALLMNPDVTVRSRGVMEKCSYCVQRINHARIDAKKDHRPIADGEIVTACEGACPSQAIVFGDINDPQSRVAQAKNDPLTYGLLAELNTRPRTTYLARVMNPNPELERPRGEGEGERGERGEPAKKGGDHGHH